MPENEALTHNQRKAIWAICRGELGWDRDAVHEYIGRGSVNDLSRIEAKELLDILNRLVGEKERNWYRICEEQFFLPANVKSVQPVKPGQMRLIIHLAGEVFEQNIARFKGFLMKRKGMAIISTYGQAVGMIETLKSMNQRGGKRGKSAVRG